MRHVPLPFQCLVLPSSHQILPCFMLSICAARLVADWPWLLVILLCLTAFCYSMGETVNVLLKTS